MRKSNYLDVVTRTPVCLPGKKHKKSSKHLIGEANSADFNILYKEPYLSEILEMRGEGRGHKSIAKIMKEKYPELENIPKHQYYTAYKSIERFG